jgi:predicted transcriptional regulator
MLDGNEPRLIGRLLRSQIIKPFQAGFIITDDALTSALKLEKKVEK